MQTYIIINWYIMRTYSVCKQFYTQCVRNKKKTIQKHSFNLIPKVAYNMGPTIKKELVLGFKCIHGGTYKKKSYWRAKCVE